MAGLNNEEITSYMKLYENVQAESKTNPQLGLTTLDFDGGYRIDGAKIWQWSQVAFGVMAAIAVAEVFFLLDVLQKMF